MNTGKPIERSNPQGSSSSKCIQYSLTATIVFAMLALITGKLGAIVMTGTTGFPGPGFFIFGGLAFISLAVFCLAGVYKAFTSLFRP